MEPKPSLLIIGEREREREREREKTVRAFVWPQSRGDSLHGSESRPFWVVCKEIKITLYSFRARIYTPVLNKNCECSATVFATELINQTEAGRRRFVQPSYSDRQKMRFRQRLRSSPLHPIISTRLVCLKALSLHTAKIKVC